MSEIDFLKDIPVNALVAGDKAAFAELVEGASPKIYNLALRMMQNEQDAEDVLQETFIKAYKALSNFERRSSLMTWLYRIAVNEALMLMRKRKGKDPGTLIEVDNDDQGTTPLEIVDWCCLPEAEFQRKETRDQLQAAIEQLPQNMRLVFILRDIQGLSVKETADILQTNESVVKTRLVRARLKLREILSVYFKERIRSEVNDG
jgi:RNA polymerase sigma-70 factor, ECF subfamily